MNPETLEGFVDADEVGKFLPLNRRRILELARARKLPGHPIGDGARRVWQIRQRISFAGRCSESTSRHRNMD